MRKVKTLRILVFVLLALNMAFLAFHFYMARHHHPGKNNIKEMVIRDLHFDQKQETSYEKAIWKHRYAISQLDQKRTYLKAKLYQLLDDKNQDTTEQAKLIAQIGNLQMQMEKVNYDHFQRIYAICRPDQIVYFKKFQTKLARLFEHRKPPKR